MTTDPFGGSLIAHIAQRRYFDPASIPDTPGDIAARAAREAPDFHTLPQHERDARVRVAMEAASWD